MTLDREIEIAQAFNAAMQAMGNFRDVPAVALRQAVWEEVYKRCPCTEVELNEVMDAFVALITNPVMQQHRRDYQKWQRRKHLYVVQ